MTPNCPPVDALAIGQVLQGTLPLVPYNTAFHTVCWFCSNGTALTWTIQNRQSCGVRHCPPARFPASGSDVKSHVSVEIGRLEQFCSVKFCPLLAEELYLVQLFIEVTSTHKLHHKKKKRKENMVVILEARIQSRDEGMARCQHHSFLLSHNLTNIAEGDASFFQSNYAMKACSLTIKVAFLRAPTCYFLTPIYEKSILHKCTLCFLC